MGALMNQKLLWSLAAAGLLAFATAAAAGSPADRAHLEKALADVVDAKKELHLVTGHKDQKMKVAVFMVNEAQRELHREIAVQNGGPPPLRTKR
jgi:hypothetical protein